MTWSRRRSVFKGITIRMDGPLCTCLADEVDLGWGLGFDRQGCSILVLSCANCGTELRVSHQKFVARFDLDRPYPKREPEPKAQVVHLRPVNDAPSDKGDEDSPTGGNS
jgi:hypothetical protein